MKQILIVLLFSISSWSAFPQVLSGADPDSVLAEWLEAGEWEGVSLHPDIAMDWLLDMDSTIDEVTNNRAAGTHLFTVSIPVNASFFDWTSDSGDLISPVSVRYRIKISESHRWEFRLQTNKNAGDTCLKLPDTGLPEHVSSGFLIRPGQIFQEIIIGDFQVNSGFGAVAGSSPVFGTPNAVTTSVTGLTIAGNYVFNIAVNDATNTTSRKVYLIVYASNPPPVSPGLALLGLLSGSIPTAMR